MCGTQLPLRNVAGWSWVFCSLIFTLGQRAAAQSLWDSQENQQKVTFYGGILGNAGPLGSVTELRSSLGYAFNQHVELEAGFPFYWVSPSSNVTTNISGSRAGIGNAFLVTIGNADIARDNGYSAWIHVNAGSRFGLGAGYNRSVHYGLNSFFFGITCEVPLLHRNVNYNRKGGIQNESIIYRVGKLVHRPELDR